MKLPSNRVKRQAAFSAIVGLMSIGWLVVLPRLARTLTIDSAGRDERIDPVATFYTEVDVLPAIQERLRIARTRHPAAFGFRP